MPLEGNFSYSQANMILQTLGKSARTLTDKTLILRFNPHIEQGLKDGTMSLMKTKQGETLADAVWNTNRQIAGKGRVDVTNNITKFSTIGFQLLSVAVAQAHLAEINKNLEKISKQIDDILLKLESNDRAEIRGGFEYINSIIQDFKNNSPKDISIERSTQIENLILKSYQWQIKAEQDFENAITSFKNQKNDEWFGTGDTYQSLKTSLMKIKSISERKELLDGLKISLHFITTSIDPNQNKFTRIKFDHSFWNTMLSALAEYTEYHLKESISLETFWNQSETINNRRKSIAEDSAKTYKIITRSKKLTDELCEKIEKTTKKINNGSQPLIAITTDKNGGAQKISLIPYESS